ncbi:hypothetical protein WICANDRAFT_62206 [Wickerhamomyces anomalus NRRL Y-366-8]|uniref:Uncharacterized protein n=1 Tax=Wickerhamomyces anomalus (strain ATCC 58044 / CBS 1984 / NCYC 433 / NRRL Y-366-8) TaxID=683960 RepID=A0A1E3P296_WICAA|nr:uncharacterized protein WICANDRAFT_62206 [Wickerhamomyces anomalus NRRL Y-366-8]ODQ59619.1 hypothetical protein WICANDRAFT_62206 [Wickerhamomyces anomalus NRRL Y-366-8]
MSLQYKRIKDILVLLIPILVVDSLFISSSLFIQIIHHPKSFSPCSLEYVRTFILATLSSSLVNIGSKYFRHFYNLKVIIEFLALLLLAYPQKTEIEQTFSNWNLVKRESYLFGAIYNLINHSIYLYGEIRIIWFQPLDYAQIEVTRQQSNENISELVRQKSTLSNCIQVRRNSYIKKNVYSPVNNIGESSLNENDYLLKSDQINNNNNTLVVDYNSDSIEFLNPSTSYNNDHSKTPNLTPVHTNYGSVVSFTSLNNLISPPNPSKSPLISILEIIAWSIISSFYEIGISLILSITFIYVPDLDDSLFSWLEIYYYNNIDNFIVEVVVPVGIITSFVHYCITSNYQTSPQLTLVAFFAVSFVLFTFGLGFT